MLKNLSKKTIALALATVTFGLPLFSNDALAASHIDQKSIHKIENRMDYKTSNLHAKHKIHKEHYKQKPAHRHESRRHYPHHTTKSEHHSSNGKLVTGLVIGAILGTVIANSN